MVQDRTQQMWQRLRQTQDIAAALDALAIPEYTLGAPAILRVLVDTISAVLVEHTATTGWCPSCQSQAPCRTRQLIERHLLRRPHAFYSPTESTEEAR